jgi:hypothetical protein
MCLFPGMMGPSPANNAPPIVKMHRKRLFILCLFHFILAFMLMWVDSYKALYEMIAAMELALAAYSVNFCFLLFYVMLMLNDTVYYLCIVGLYIQDDFFKLVY